MIEDKFVDLYARDSGLRDKLVAERDIALTYALHGLLAVGVMDDLAFKGGTCLRKMTSGSSGRFSEDLDFTLDSDRPADDVLVDLIEAFSREHYGIAFTCGEYYKTEADMSFGAEVLYRHTWNEVGHFRLQVSLRRLVRPGECIEPGEVLSTVEARFASLRELSELEQQVVADAKGGWNRPLGKRLQEDVRGRFADMPHA